MFAPKRRNHPAYGVKRIFRRLFKDIHRTIQKCSSRGLEVARSYTGKIVSFSSSQEASKDREFVTPFDIQSLNRVPNRTVVGRHSITFLAGYSAGLAILSTFSCLCAQTGETFCRKVVAAGKPVDGHQGGAVRSEDPSDRRKPRMPGRPGRGCQSLMRGGNAIGEARMRRVSEGIKERNRIG